MATIQFRRQLKFGHPKEDALKYIRKKLAMVAGEPLICTYKDSDGKWGAVEVVCVYPKETPKDQTIIADDSYFDAESKLIENYIIVNDAAESVWESI